MDYIVERILMVAEKAIWENGGRKIERDNKVYYEIHTDF